MEKKEQIEAYDKTNALFNISEREDKNMKEEIKNVTLKFTKKQFTELETFKKTIGSTSWESFFTDLLRMAR